MSNHIPTILLPIDFSDCSENALYYSIGIARACKSKIIVLHVRNPEVKDGYEDVKQTADIHARIMSYCNKIQHAGNIEYQCVQAEGEVVEEILSSIKSYKVKLVVMGTRGMGSVDDILLGNNTSRVISDAACPVLAVPRGAGYSFPTKIAFATDYHQQDAAILHYLLDLAGDEFIQINFLHISARGERDPSEKNKMLHFIRNIEQHVKYPNLSFQLLPSDDPEKGILHYLESKSADLLVISPRHKNAWEKLYAPGITKGIVLNSHTPILAFSQQHETTPKLV